jgi:hypothetical protein
LTAIKSHHQNNDASIEKKDERQSTNQTEEVVLANKYTDSMARALKDKKQQEPRPGVVEQII